MKIEKKNKEIENSYKISALISNGFLILFQILKYYDKYI